MIFSKTNSAAKWVKLYCKPTWNTPCLVKMKKYVKAWWSQNKMLFQLSHEIGYMRFTFLYTVVFKSSVFVLGLVLAKGRQAWKRKHHSLVKLLGYLSLYSKALMARNLGHWQGSVLRYYTQQWNTILVFRT